MSRHYAKCLLSLLLASGVWQCVIADILELDQSKAIELALKKNFSVRIAKINPLIAEESIEQAKGAFDPRVDVSYTHRDNESVANAEANSYRAGISGRTPLGTTYDLGLQVTESRDQAVSQELPFTSFVGISIRQPLLDGFGYSSNLTELRIAETRHELNEWEFRQVVMNVITDVIIAYHDYYFAAHNLEVVQRNRDLARKLLEDNRKRVQAGGMAPLDIGQNESQLALREERVLVAQNTLNFRGNQLKQLIGDDAQSMLNQSINVVSLPNIGSITTNPIEDYSAALAQRPDYQQALRELHIAGLLLKQSRNQALPALDIIAGYGLGGDGNSFGSSLQEISSDHRMSYELGFAFNQAIPNRADRARRIISELNVNLGEISLESLEQSILFDLDTFARRVQNDWKRVEISGRARELAETTLAAQERQLQVGTSTTFVVLRLQSDLANAEIRELIALTDYNKNLARYDLLLGRAGYHFGIADL